MNNPKINSHQWWCDCGEFQALHLLGAHVIILQLTTFFYPSCILKAYEVEFYSVWNQDYWSTYMNWISSQTPTCTVRNQAEQQLIVYVIKWMNHFQINQTNALTVGMKATIEQIIRITNSRM